MKVLRYAVLAIVCFLLFQVSPSASAVIRVSVCDGGIVTSGWIDPRMPVPGAVNATAGCRNTYAFWDEDRGGNPKDYGRGDRGGRPHAPSPAPNQGDVAASQRDPSEKSSCDRVGNPVVFSTGNKIELEPDFASAGEMPLSLTRTYNYYWNGIGIFGRRWLSDYDYKLLFMTDDPTSPCYPRPGSDRCDPTNQPIWAQRPDGRKIKFNYSSTPLPGWYEDKANPIAKIIQIGSTYTLYSENRTVEVYDYYGFPSTIHNQQGIGWTFSYGSDHYLTKVTHSSGRHVDFRWSNGQLTQVIDPAGNVYRYSYITITVANSLAALSTVSAGSISPDLMMPPPLEPDDPPPIRPTPIPLMTALLTTAIQPSTPGSSPGTTISYQYGDARFPTALTGKTINGQRYGWYSYDANGRVQETKHAYGVDDFQLAYVLDNNKVVRTVITNPLGKKTTYDFNEAGNITGITGQASSHCQATYKVISYDGNGYPSGTVDFNDNATLYTYAANGQLLQRVVAPRTAITQTTNYTWDPSYSRVTKVAVVGNHEVAYTYTSNNRLASVTVKNSSGRVPSNQGQTHKTSITYASWSNGLLKSMVMDGPLAGSGDAIITTFSQVGDLLTVRDALGHATTYDGHNGLGLPGVVTGPNGDRHIYL